MSRPNSLSRVSGRGLSLSIPSSSTAPSPRSSLTGALSSPRSTFSLGCVTPSKWIPSTFALSSDESSDAGHLGASAGSDEGRQHPALSETDRFSNFHAKDLQWMMKHCDGRSSFEEMVDDREHSDFEQSKFFGSFVDGELEKMFMTKRLYSGFFGIATAVFAVIVLAALYAIVLVVVAPFGAARFLFPSTPRSRFVGPAVARAVEFFIIGSISLGVVFVNLIMRWTCLRKWTTSTATNEKREGDRIPKRVANLYLVFESIIFCSGIAWTVVNDIAFVAVDMAGFQTDFLNMDRVDFIYYGVGCISICIVVFPLRFRFKVLWAGFGIVFCSLVQIPGFVRDLSSTECLACVIRNFAGVLLFVVGMFVGALISQYSAEMTLRKKFQKDLRLQRLLKHVHNATERSKRILRHLIPRQFVETVECGATLLQVVRGVSAIQLDIVNFTSWCCRTDCLVVIRYLNRLFGSLDRVSKEVGVLKLSQAGDAWIGVSFPRFDEDGLGALLIVARTGLVNARKDVECDLEVRIGIGYDGLSNGYLVCWGRRMLSLEFVGAAMDEAQWLEETGISGTVHIGEQAWKILRDPLSVEDGTSDAPFLSLRQISSMTSDFAAESWTSDGGESEESSASVALTRMSRRIWSSCSVTNLNISRKACFVNSCVSCLVSACLCADLSMNSLASPLCVGLGLVVTFFVHLAAFVNLAIMPMRFLQLTHTLLSFFILLTRTVYASVVIAKFHPSSSLTIRFLMWDVAFSLLNLQIHPLLLPLVAVRIPVILVLQSYLSDNVDLTTDVLELGFYAIHVVVISPLPMFYHAVARFVEMDVKRRLKKTEEELKKTVRLLNEKHLRAQGILDSFLPPHVIESLSQSQSIYAERVECGGVVFVSFSLPKNSSLPKIDQIHRINEMICELDLIVCRHSSAMKIKSMVKSYLCILQSATLLDLVDLAQLMLASQSHSSINQSMSLKIGVGLGPFSAGIIGEDRWYFDCVGTTVNLAARLACFSEKTTGGGGVWILGTESGIDGLLGDSWSVEWIRGSSLKGIGEVDIVHASVIQDRE